MRFTLSRSGGFAAFPGLEQEVVVDTMAMPADQARPFTELAATARLGADPRPVPAGAADHFTYYLTIDDGVGPVRELEFREPVDDPSLAELVRLLRSVDR